MRSANSELFRFLKETGLSGGLNNQSPAIELGSCLQLVVTCHTNPWRRESGCEESCPLNIDGDGLGEVGHSPPLTPKHNRGCNN